MEKPTVNHYYLPLILSRADEQKGKKRPLHFLPVTPQNLEIGPPNTLILTLLSHFFMTSRLYLQS